MAPIKFEEQIKEKLEQRTLEPSVDAWSKLSYKLDADAQSHKKPFYWWFGIAASIALLVMLSISYFKNGTNENLEENVVKEQNITPKKLQTPILEKEKNNDLQLVNNTAIENDIKDEPIVEHKPKTLKKPKPVDAIKSTQNERLEVVAGTEKIENPTAPVLEKPTEVVTNIEFRTLMAELEKVKTENTNPVTDREIDSLLKVANRELLREKIIKNRTQVVDADALLQDVEDDLGQSFRTRIYETLKDSYKRVKTAVAQRND